MPETPDRYRAAGVDASACAAWLDRLKSSLPGIGGFAGVLPLGPHLAGMREPCLVAGADGVGTKVLIARAAGELTTIGIDCVAMVANDLICCGARPIAFLDYLAVGAFDAAEADAIISGMRVGCDEAGCELLGGETAELPGLIRRGEFDIAGFGIGVVDRERLINGEKIRAGDAIIGLASSGIHANGLSLAREIFSGYAEDSDLLDELLKPTAIYVNAVRAALEKFDVKGVAHVTGGGLPGNLTRILCEGLGARLDPALWARPEIFDRLRLKGGIADDEMFRVFNMGIGMCLILGEEDAKACARLLEPWGAAVIGEVTSGPAGVEIEGVGRFD